MKKLPILVTGAVLAAIALPAHADFKISVTRSNNFGTFNERVSLPLNDAGAKIRTFNLPSAQAMVLHYSAICMASGTDGWLDIDIVVNGRVVAPTVGNEDIVCTTGEGALRAAISVRIEGIAGTNTVRIDGRRNGGAIHMQFARSSLLVFDP
jgi:hypothetical protein